MLIALLFYSILKVCKITYCEKYYLSQGLNLELFDFPGQTSLSIDHRGICPFLSEQENKQMYGKCNNVWGHGHNYTVEVTVRGPVDPLTGMVMNLEDLKDCMEKVLMDQMDHKNIDKQIDYFRETVSTTENVAIYIFEELKKHMSNSELLYEVKVHETDKNVMCFRGEYDENVFSP